MAREHGISLDGQEARRVAPDDLREFDLVIAMDRSNLDDLQRLQERHGGAARLALLREFDPDPGDGEVPDPYYGGEGGFDRVFEMVDRACARLVEQLQDGM